MKHRVAGRKLGRTSAHRLAVLRNLATDLFRYERIQTTLMKAKELRPFAEKLITTGKRGDLHARRRLARHIRDAGIAKKLVDTLSTRFSERPGGYTRILKLGPRRGDSAEMAIVELLGSEPTFAPKEEEKKQATGLGRIRERLSRGRRSTVKKAAEAGKDETAKPDEGEESSEAPAARKPNKPKASSGAARARKTAPEKKKSSSKAAGKSSVKTPRKSG